MGYRIKTVSKLTGVPRNTLLAWERRYGLVTPSRQDNGYREYSDSDIACLQSVKRLLDQGYKVSEAVELIRAVREQGTDGVAAPGQLSVAVIHRTLPGSLGNSSIAVAHHAADIGAFIEGHGGQQADLLVAGLETLGSDPLGALRAAMEATGASQAIVIYQFATHATLQRLVTANVRLIHGAPRLRVVRQAIDEQSALHHLVARPRSPTTPIALPVVSDDVVPRRFTDAQLAQLREIRSAIDCECPNHISSLVTALLAFEEYSRNCESNNPQDAELHNYLTQTTGAARQLLEDMLEAVIVQDQIQL